MYKMLLFSLFTIASASFAFAEKNTAEVTLNKDDVAVVVTVDGKLFTKYVYNDEKASEADLVPGDRTKRHSHDQAIPD